MRTKVNDPYIYFLIEPAIVVYRIEMQKYITKLDLSDDNWELFEIDHRDGFETFNHEEGKLLEGRGFFVNQEGLSKMVEDINTYIQENRHANKLEDQAGAVHIVTSESAAGSLRVALEHPKTVIGFPDSFSMGPLWKLDRKTGQSFRKEWLLENINTEQEDGEYERKFANTLREIEDIAAHMPIYIWYGNNADEQTGLHFYLYLLQEKPNEIYLMNTTDLYERYGAVEEGQVIFHTSQMDSDDLRGIYDNHKERKPLSDEKRLQFYREWESLAKTKDVLRLWAADEIKSVAEHYYDWLILEAIENLHKGQETKKFIQTASVIGDILVEMDAYIDYYFLEYRIRHLVYDGALELKGIPKSAWHYSVKLK